MTKSLLNDTNKKVYFDPDNKLNSRVESNATGANSVTPMSSKESNPIDYTPIESTSTAHREHDTEVGRRIVKKISISPENVQEASEQEEIALANELEANELMNDHFCLTWLSKTLRVAILLVTAFVMFFIVTQTASFLVSVRHLTRTEQILLAIPMLLFGSIILWYLMKLLFLFLRLRVSPQIRIKALHELSERRHLRDLSMKANREAIEKLCGLLEDKRTYASENYAKTLRALSVSKEQILELDKSRQRLIENAWDMPGTTRDWINDFYQDFQKPLDQIAERSIRKHYVHAAIMTGISPYPLLDRLIVLQECLSMVKDLLNIYALKPSWDKNLLLLAKVITNTYLAGVIDTAAESGMDSVMDSIPELTKNTLSKGMDTVIRKGGGKAAGMITQGYFVNRLGNATMKMLSPVQEA